MVKNIIIAALAAAVLFQWFRGCNLRNDYEQLKGEYLLKDSAYIAAAQDAKRWKTENGLNVLRVNSLEVSKTSLEAYNNDLRAELKAAKIKPKNIKRQTSLSTVTAGTIKPKTDTVFVQKKPTAGTISDPADTSKGKIDTVVNFSYSDKWVDFAGTVKPEFLIRYNIRDSLRLFWHYSRDGIFKPKKLRLTVYSLNPNATVSGIRDFEVKSREKRFFIGIGASYSWNGQKFAPGLGLIGGYKLLKF